jgi:serine protease Do
MRAPMLQKIVSPLVLFVYLFFCQVATANTLPDFTSLVEKNGPAVVNISTSQDSEPPQRQQRNKQPIDPEEVPDLFRHFFGEEGGFPPIEKSSLGSGFIISSDGYVLTNNHVVEKADQILVRLFDRRELVAKVIGKDKRSDIALLKIEAKDLPVVNIGNSNQLKVGEWVLAIGSPYGFERSVTAGIVSAKGRSLPRDNYVPFIQTDVAINPGNSGGPLFNLNGEVIGINSQIYSRTGGFMGLSFAIPIDVAMDVAEQLKKSGQVQRGWLGVLIQEVNRELAETFSLPKPMGALVAEVVADGPAEKAGIKAGDIILKVGDHTIDMASDLPPFVGRMKPEEKVELTVLREGKQTTLSVELGALPADETPLLASSSQKQGGQDVVLGLKVIELTEAQKSKELKQGVVVQGVYKGPPQNSGVQINDVITMLNYQPVSSVQDFRLIAKALPKGKSVPMQIQRQGNPMFIPIRISE